MTYAGELVCLTNPHNLIVFLFNCKLEVSLISGASGSAASTYSVTKV